ncbi:unnamed protein product [Lymnaea stagnalis]|uniref:Uncharacterized protein n=1 Tax=Lymnaea stagnalis TaxID=6523 RepID=A0AAV2H8H5_LYMST
MQRETFEPGVFAPLAALAVLKLNKNTKRVFEPAYVYPDEALSELRNLTDLHIDGLPLAVFGPGFNRMTSLRRLVLSGLDEGYCKMGFLSNDTFSNVAQLTYLNVSDCSILVNGSGIDAFAPLQNLEGLDVTFNLKLGFNHLADLLRPLNDSNLTCLTMTSINNRYSTGEAVTSSFASSLPRKLEFLVARENALEMIEDGAIETLPPDLKYIDLGDNRLTFSTYLKDLPMLKNLKHLMLNSIGYIFRVPKGYPPPAERTIQLPWGGSCEEPGDCIDTGRFELFLPPNLKVLDMSVMDLKYILSDLFVNANNSLQKLVLDDNYFPSLEGPIYGLEKLTELHLKHTSVSSIKKAFFQNFNSLQKLFLARNRLGAFFENSGQSNPIFEDLKISPPLTCPATG